MRTNEIQASKVDDAFHAPPPVSELLSFILDTLDDSKAIDPATIDLKGKSSIADYLVIVNGRSQRHVASIADQLEKKLRNNGYGRAQVEGLPQADWVLLDAGDIIVHIFRPEVRTFYNLEKMWSVNIDEPNA